MAQAGAHLSCGEGSNPSQAGSQAFQAVTSKPGTHLSPREGSSSAAGSQASQASQVAGRLVTSPSPKEGGSLAASPASQAGAHLPPAGETLPKQVRQAVKLLGQAGNTPGNQPGKGPYRLPRGTKLHPRQTVLVPGMAIPPLTPLIGSLKGLPWKSPTLSGSLTYPATFDTSTKVCSG